MSIFASLRAPEDGEHVLPGCSFYFLQDNTYEFSGKPCDCGQPDAPLKYQGSHVLPSDNDARGGSVDIALIPPHVRYWRELGNEVSVETEPDIDTYAPEPFLRFGVNGEAVILTVRNVQEVYESLTYWLEQIRSKPSPADAVSSYLEAKAQP